MTETANDTDKKNTPASVSAPRGRLKSFWGKILHSNSLIFTFLRSIASSQCASWIDMFIGFCLFAWAGFTPAVATVIGAMSGGVVNCVINYRFTFHADGVDWRAVAVKYILVWIGSAALNSFGTEAVYIMIDKWEWLRDLGFKPDGFYATARLFTSLMVSWFWNFPMQRYYVYRPSRCDSHAIALFAWFGVKK